MHRKLTLKNASVHKPVLETLMITDVVEVPDNQVWLITLNDGATLCTYVFILSVLMPLSPFF